MKKRIFFKQKENLTLYTLTLLIIMTCVMMRFQHNNKAQHSEYSDITTSKAKTETPNQREVPHFLPAL